VAVAAVTVAVVCETVDVTGAVADWTVDVRPPTRSAEAVAGAAKQTRTRATRRPRERVARRGRANRWSGG
jgi:hypothetical protein